MQKIRLKIKYIKYDWIDINENKTYKENESTWT